MVPYIIFLALALVIGNIAYRKGQSNSLGIVLLFLLMTLFAGLRSADVGTDTWSYVMSFQERQNNNSPNQSLSITDDFGFEILEGFLASFSTQYATLLIVIAAIANFFALRGIRVLSIRPLVSLFFFITLGYYTFFFNASRQGIAVSIYMMALPYLLQRKLWPYVLIVLAASTFHHSVLVAIPLYFVLVRKYSSSNLIIVILGGLVLGFIAPDLIEEASSYDSKLAGYKELSATGGYMLTTFYVMLSVFFLYQRKWIVESSRNRYDVFLQMMILSSMIYLVVTVAGLYVELCRFAAYFQIASIFMWPEVLYHRTKPLPQLLYYGIIIVHLAFFFMYISAMGNLVPYSLNRTFVIG